MELETNAKLDTTSVDLGILPMQAFLNTSS